MSLQVWTPAARGVLFFLRADAEGEFPALVRNGADAPEFEDAEFGQTGLEAHGDKMCGAAVGSRECGGERVGLDQIDLRCGLQ